MGELLLANGAPIDARDGSGDTTLQLSTIPPSSLQEDHFMVRYEKAKDTLRHRSSMLMLRKITPAPAAPPPSPRMLRTLPPPQ